MVKLQGRWMNRVDHTDLRGVSIPYIVSKRYRLHKSKVNTRKCVGEVAQLCIIATDASGDVHQDHRAPSNHQNFPTYTYSSFAHAM